MARVLIVGGGCRGRRLAAELVGEGSGHAVRIVTRTEAGRGEIEASGAECLIGSPDRLATLRGALDGVTIACWLLATATGESEQVRALHGSRLESFLAQAIDTTMRGFVYEAPGAHAGPAVAGAADDVVYVHVHATRAPACAPELGRVDELGRGIVPGQVTAEGEHIVRAMTTRNAIPVAFVRADPGNTDAWLADARGAVDLLLGV